MLGSAFIAGAIGLPIHYLYGLATLGHLGPFYVVTAFVLVGSWLGYRAAEA